MPWSKLAAQCNLYTKTIQDIKNIYKSLTDPPILRWYLKKKILKDFVQTASKIFAFLSLLIIEPFLKTFSFQLFIAEHVYTLYML